MNIVNVLSLIWTLLTWSLLKLVHLPEERLVVFRATKKKNKSEKLSDKLLKSVHQFNQDSVLNAKIKDSNSLKSLSNPEKIN